MLNYGICCRGLLAPSLYELAKVGVRLTAEQPDAADVISEWWPWQIIPDSANSPGAGC